MRKFSLVLLCMVLLQCIYIQCFGDEGDDLPYQSDLVKPSWPEEWKLTADSTPLIPLYMRDVNGYSESDLTKEHETAISAEINQKVEELKYDPVKIYEYVKNNIDYIPYYGSKLGATGALMQRRANSFDQASLLIAMLRHAGIPCRYVWGGIKLEKEDAMNWLGVENVKATEEALIKSGLTFIDEYSTGSISYKPLQNGKLLLHHVWVEAYLPYAGTRGNPINYKMYNFDKGHIEDCGERMWIPLDPSFKKYENKFPVRLIDGMPVSAMEFLNQFITAEDENMPDELYSENLSKFLSERNSNISLEDLSFERRIIPEKLSILPTELPAAISIFKITGENYALETSDVWKVCFRARRYTDGQDILYSDASTKGITKPLCDLYNKRITLSYSPDPVEGEGYFERLTTLSNNFAGTNVLTPEFRIEGEIVNYNTNQKVRFLNSNTYSQRVTTTIFNDGTNPEFITATYNNVITNPLQACDQSNYAEVTSDQNFLQVKLNGTAGLSGTLLNVYVGFNVYQKYGFRDRNANYAECSVSNGQEKVAQKISVERQHLGALGYIDPIEADAPSIFGNIKAWASPWNAIRLDSCGSFASHNRTGNAELTVTFAPEQIGYITGIPHDCFLHVHHRDGNSQNPSGKLAVKWGSSPDEVIYRFPQYITDSPLFKEDVIFIPEGMQDEYRFFIYESGTRYATWIDYVTQEYRLLKPNKQMSSFVLDATSLVGSNISDLENLTFQVQYVGDDDHVKFFVYNIFLIVEYLNTVQGVDDQEQIELTTIIDVPRRKNYIVNTVTRKTGEVTALHLNYDNTPNLDLLESRYSRLKEYEEKIDAGTAKNCDEAPVGELLNSVGCQYFYNLSQSAEKLASVMNMHTNTAMGLAIASQTLNIVTNQSTTTVFPGTYKLDIFYGHTDFSRINDDIATRDFNFLSGMTYSAHEHKVFEDIFNIRSLSTMRILRMAHEASDDETNPNKVLFIDKNNYTALTSTSNLSFIYNHFNSNLIVNADDIFIIPERALNGTEAGDSGLNTGYIHLFDPTGNAAYFIDGNDDIYNGGFLTLSMDAVNTNETFANGMHMIDFSGASERDVNISILSDGKIKVYIEGTDPDSFLDTIAYEVGMEIMLPSDTMTWQEKQAFCETIQGGYQAYYELIDANINDPSQIIGSLSEFNNEQDYVIQIQGMDGDSQGSDPVDMRTGEFYAESVDVEIPGLLPIVIKRNYSSQQESMDFIGYGWTLNLNYFLWGNGAALDLAENYTSEFSLTQKKSVILRLTEDDGSVLEYIYGNETGNTITFVPDPMANTELVNIALSAGTNKNAGYISNRIVFNTLSKEFIYTSYDGTKKYFTFHAYSSNENGKERIYLSKIEDIHGNYLQYTYHEDENSKGFGLPSTITSRSGCYVQFYYDIKGRVERIVSSDKREIRYFYDNLWNLVKVIDAAGKTTKYEYARSPDGYLTHNLARIIKPDNRILENIYDGEKVIEQRMAIGFDAIPRTIAQFEYTHDGAGHQITNEYTFVREESDGEIKKTLKEYKYKDYTQCILNFNDQTFGNSSLNGTGLSITAQNDTDCYVNGAFSCPNQGTYISIGQLGNLVGATKTIEFNFKCSAGYIILYEQQGLQSTNTITLSRVGDTLTITASIENLTPLEAVKTDYPEDDWYHICLSLDTVNDRINLYFNGILEDSESTSKTTLIENTSSNIILKAGVSGTPDLPGSIDNFGMYSLTKLPARKTPLRLLSTTEKGFQLSDTEWEFNSIISKTYNDQGYVTSITDENDEFTITDYWIGEFASAPIETTYDYDVIRIYNYDSQGRVIETIVDPDGSIASTLLDDDGNIDYTNATGGRFRTYLDGLSNDYFEVTSTWYVDSDNLLLSNKVSEIVDPMGTKKKFIYDGESTSPVYFTGALLKMEKYDSSSTLRYRETYTYYSNTHLLYEKTVVNLTDSTKNITYKYAYDRFGNLASIENPLGEKTTFLFDEWGNRIQTTNPEMESTRIQYNNANMPIKVTDPMGYSQEIFYDKNNNKIAEIDPNGNMTTYLYDYSDSLIGVMDPQGNTVVTDHDIFGNKLCLINQKGYAREFEYDGKNRLIKEIDRLENDVFETVYTYDDNGNILKIEKFANGITISKKEYNYNHRNQVILEKKYRDNAYFYQKRYNYDKIGNKVDEIIYSFTDSNMCGYFNAYFPYLLLQYTYSTEFDGTYKVKNICKNKLDFLNGDMRFYLKIEPPLQEFSYTYDHRGNLKSKTDPMGYSKTYAYDNADRLISVTQPVDANDQGTVTSSAVTQYKYDRAGRISEIIDPLNFSLKTVYDRNGRVIRLIDQEDRQTRYEYDSNGNRTREILPSGQTKSYVYDALNRNTAIIDEKQNTSLIEYDALGNVILTADPKNNVTLCSYDNWNRLVHTQDPMEYTVEYSYTYDSNGILLKTMEAQMEPGKVRKTQWKYNWNNENIQKIDGPSDNEKITSFQYNYNGFLGQKTTPNQQNENFIHCGNCIYYYYDYIGNLINICSYERQSTPIPFGFGTRINISFEYDKNGNRTQMSDESGTTRYTYFPNGLLKNKIQDGNQVSVSYKYDKNGNTTQVTFTGINPDINSQYQNISQTVTCTYNTANELTSVACNGKNISYTYNKAGQLITKTLPQTAIQYSYDALDRLETLQAGSLFTERYGYDILGNIVSVDHSGYVSRYGYDAKNQLAYELYKNADGFVNKKSYTYDGTGNRLTMFHQTGNTANPPAFSDQTHTYIYNNLNQLEKIRSGVAGSAQSAVDVWGINLGTGQITVNGIPAGSLDEHVYLSTGTSTSGAITISDGGAETVTLTPDADSDVCYTYDANGNLGFKSVNDGQSYFYLWDSLDRLKAIYYYNEDEQEIHRVEYTYNGDGEKIFEIRDGVRTGYLYDAGRLIAEYNASGKVFAQYIHGSGLGGDVGSLLFAQKLIGSGEETSVETSYYFHNWRGDVVAVTDESGNPLDTYRYSAFGEVIEQSGASDNDILFSSKRYHGATALSYFGARYYDASIGRFISRDPLGFVDGPNQYIYCANNPVNFIDPFGYNQRMLNKVNNALASLILFANICIGYNGTTIMPDPVSPIIDGPGSLGALDLPLDNIDRFPENNFDRPFITTFPEPISPIIDGPGSHGTLDIPLHDIDPIPPDVFNGIYRNDGNDHQKQTPNPNGKKGSIEHQKAINDTIEDIKARGLKPKTEEPITTVNGAKSVRFMDVVGKDPETEAIKEVHQIGKTLTSKPNVPVSRERAAFRDVRHSPELKGAKRIFKGF
ncbi:MAG: RHS repeat-associated core domain-containing protein [Candidatus Auribacterota bacterium]|jgi:RHS repeat-associated protein|nr:RHS repeat-associated core domain-containing protein [Candidatus Auribacterota bacterium]